MRQLAITTYGMKVLRKKTKPVTKIDDSFIGLIRDMFFTMDKASGIGLASPQVNLDMSLAVVDISGIDEYKDEKPIILINPEIIETHGKVIMEEGCLSIPDVRAEVERPDEIFLRFHDLDMNEVEMELTGFLARVAQHEIDHLNGKLFIDYLSQEIKDEFKEALSLIRKGNIETEYPLLIHSQKN